MVYIIEGVNYSNLCRILEFNKSSRLPHGVNKKEMQNLLLLASSNRERETLKYAIFKVSGLTPTAARRELGLGDMRERTARVEDAIQQIIEIRQAFDKIIETRVQCVRMVSSSSDSGEDMDVGDHDTTPNVESVCPEETVQKLDLLLRESSFNWFHSHEKATKMLQMPEDQIDSVLMHITVNWVQFSRSKKMCHLKLSGQMK